MGKKHDKLDKADRRTRRQAHAAAKQAARDASSAAFRAAHPESATKRRDPVTLIFGKHPSARMTLVFSGVPLPFDETDPEPNAGLVELTALALAESKDKPD